MNDTPPDVTVAFRALMMQRTEGERAVMAFEMFDLARLLMTADIRAQHPGITETELRVKIFERTYGGDLEPADRARIAARIRAAAGGLDRSSC
jgi:hypothetical protein